MPGGVALIPDTPEARRRLNRLAREQMKARLLQDIRADMLVCRLEGWSETEFLEELAGLLEELRGGHGKGMD